MEILSSIHNPTFKLFKKLVEKSSFRKEQKLFVVEGLREINIALKSGYTPKILIDCPEIPYQSDQAFFAVPKDTQLVHFAKKLIQKLAYRENSDGCLAIFSEIEHSFKSITLTSTLLLLAIEGSEKPGNLGAVLRTADAVGASAVILLDYLGDIFNPNVIRTSLGCVFSLPVIKASNQDFLKWAKSEAIEIVLTTPHTDILYTSYLFKGRNAILFGSEADGLSDFWMHSEHSKIKLPMHGAIDSLNLSNCVAIAAYEWRKNYAL